MKQKLFFGILLTVALLCWTSLALQAADAPSKAEKSKEIQTDKKADAPKAEVKKDAPKKADAPKAEVKKDAPKKADAPKAEVKKDAPKKADAPKAEVKKDAPKKADAPKAEVKKDAPKKADAPKAEVKKDAPKKADAKITKLLRYPDIYGNEVVFTYAGDLWKAPVTGGTATRLTAHEGLEIFGKFSPDGKWIAFTSQYDGDEQVYIIPSEGGVPKQLTFYPIAGPNPPRRGYDHQVLGWTPDSKKVLFRSGRDSNSVDQLTHIYQIDINGGLPEKMPVPSAGAGDLSLDGKKLAYSPLYRDFRHWKRYEGGWAQYLNIYDLDKKTFDKIPTTPRTDRDPMWLGKDVWFVSDRDATLNLYRYDTENKKVVKETNYKDWDVRWASSDGREKIVYELGGELHVYDSKLKKDQKLDIYVPHDGLAMRPGRINVMKNIETLSLAPKAKRAVISARGDVFTVPVEKGNIRNLTKSSNAHDRAAVWSPNGKWIAWISDKTGEDQIWITDQLGQKTALPLTTDFKVRLNDLEWSSDSKALSFWDAHSRLYVLTIKDAAEKDALPIRDKIINVASAKNETPFHTAWSPDGKYLAYTLNTENDYTTIYIWDKATGKSHKVTDSMFDSFSPAWDPNGDWLFFISSREFYPQLSSIEWNYAGNRFNGLFAVSLRKDVKNIFAPESDEAEIDQTAPNGEVKKEKEADSKEKVKSAKVEKDKAKMEKKDKSNAKKDKSDSQKDKSDAKDKNGKVKKEKSKKNKKAISSKEAVAKNAEAQKVSDKKASDKKADAVTPEKKSEKKIDFNGIAERAVRIPVTSENYQDLSVAGNFLYYIKYDIPFYGRAPAGKPALKVYDLKQKKESTFLPDVSGYDISPDGSKILVAQGPSFKIFSVGPGAGPDAKPLNIAGLSLDRNPSEEWNEIFEEVWRRFRDYFYVKNMHGVNWEKIGQQYRELLPYVAHRSDLTYILTEMISELNIGHTYVDGGDFIVPDRASAGLAGAEFVLDKKAGLYKIAKIYKGHNQEEKYRSPLTEVGVAVKPGDYLFEIDGEKLTASDNPYRLLTNKSGSVSWKIGSKADGSDARTIVYKPIANESSLRYLNFVLDRMARVNKASNGRIGYLHIPDMGGNGGYEFIKWYYPQIRKEGLIIDDRNNGGGNISSWIIMRLNQKLLGTRFGSDRLSATTYPTIANNAHMVCLINETSASDGDIFPYYFRKSGLGQLIGKRSWGGVVGISSRGPLLDGGTVYVPLSATNDEKGNYIIEGHGVDPDIVVEQNPEAMLKGRDPQLERGIKELLKKIEKDPRKLPKRPAADPDKSKDKVKKY